MCGIFFYRQNAPLTQKLIDQLDTVSQLIKHRGPDMTRTHRTVNNGQPGDGEGVFIKFHRLSIMDLSNDGMQPFVSGARDQLHFPTKDRPDEVYLHSVERSMVTLVCNGEIYNSDELRRKCDDYTFESKSDCEVIIPLFLKYGVDAFDMLDGEFACVLTTPEGTYAARDGPCGIRPLFYGIMYSENTAGATGATGASIVFASEARSIIPLLKPGDIIDQFPPGHYWSSTATQGIPQTFHPFFTIDQLPVNTIHAKMTQHTLVTKNLATQGGPKTLSINPIHDSKEYVGTEESVDSEESVTDGTVTEEHVILQKINHLLTEAVSKRLNSDAPFGFLLSGGLDSSLVVSIARRVLGPDARLRTFAVGLEDSSDLRAARMVADYLDCDHTEVKLTAEDGIAAIGEVIKYLESYDQTTIYAGTYQFLLCKWIRAHTDIKVLLGGELSDEVNASYRYIGLAPSLKEAMRENIKLLNEVHYYDVLRADRMIAANGLESRVPFSDKAFVKYMLALDIEMKMPTYDGKKTQLNPSGMKMEKIWLRKAFYTPSDPYLPASMLWRKKEAFSDGVGHSWITENKVACDTCYEDGEFKTLAATYTHAPPSSKDDLFFREQFDGLFGGHSELIPHKWVPNPEWGLDTTESSARFLSNY